MAVVFKPDWSVNVANLVVVISAVLGGIGAWYDVKSDTRMNTRDIDAIKLEASQTKQDVKAELTKQDALRAAVAVDLKGAIRENKDEIKEEIRYLRSDLTRIKK